MSEFDEDALLADFACQDPVFVDDCHLILGRGNNVNLLFVRLMPKVENGLIVYEQVPGLSLIMPRTAALRRNAENMFASARMSSPQIEKPTHLRRVQ
jgi:hypothetical protein